MTLLQIQVVIDQLLDLTVKDKRQFGNQLQMSVL